MPILDMEGNVVLHVNVFERRVVFLALMHFIPYLPIGLILLLMVSVAIVHQQMG